MRNGLKQVSNIFWINLLNFAILWFRKKTKTNRISLFLYLWWTGLKKCSTSTSVYIELNEKIEYTCKLVHFVIVKLTFIGIMLPQVLITTINYFLYDLKDQSYFLSVPVMWVCHLLNYSNDSWSSENMRLFFGIVLKCAQTFQPHNCRFVFFC